jgi:hypothetical protein
LGCGTVTGDAVAIDGERTRAVEEKGFLGFLGIFWSVEKVSRRIAIEAILIK